MPREVEADYVVVGAGAAGCALAARLSEVPTATVALLEAGGGNRSPLVSVPMGFYLTLRDPALTRSYVTSPPDPAGTPEVWLRGRGRGGSTAVNGMLYVRGWSADYAGLDEAGPGSAWRWPEVLSAFRSMEDHELGPSPVRGTGGPVRVSLTRVGGEPVAEAVLAAAGSAGMAAVEDVNAGDGARIGPVALTAHRGRRVTAATAFLAPARHRTNLTVLDRCSVSHVVLRARRAVAVVARQRGRPLLVRARREVVLSAGTIETPLLLERSGIGDPDLLASAGIAPRVASPRVGSGVLEHRPVTVHARLRPGSGLNEALGSATGRVREVARYAVTRSGPLACGPYHLVGLLRSAPDQPRPDVQLLVTPMSTDLTSSRLRLADHPGMMLTGYPLRPTTPSSVHVSGPDPAAPPVIRARYLESGPDRRLTGDVLRLLRDLLARAPLCDLVLAEEAPGPGVRSPEDAVRYALRTGTGVYHAVGSCAVGPGAEHVVDAELRVRGVLGLRVVDASVFPAMPSGNTAAPAMMLGWHAATLIRPGD
jgi:choline dehydrogenase-like flavoprotein